MTNRAAWNGKMSRWCVVLALVVGTLGAVEARAFVDDENCLMCHKYPMMGRVTDTGVTRSYYIVPQIFSRTVHRNVPCRDCHVNIKELPHNPQGAGVTCNTVCHSIKNPATGKAFSHKVVYDSYRTSVHGRDKLGEGSDSDKPYCITCHTNPLYNPGEAAPPARIVNRCVTCHEDQKFADRWYNHVSRRVREIKRSSLEIVELCSSCHGDEEFIQRRLEVARVDGRELGRKFPYAAESYRRSFHGKLTRYGFTRTANCLSCHADVTNFFKSVHEIRPSRDSSSPVSSGKRLTTCQHCHTTADANYARLDPHPTDDAKDNPFVHWAELIYNIIGNIVIVGLVGISSFETFGRWRDGVAWRLRRGSSWQRPGRKGRRRFM